MALSPQADKKTIFALSPVACVGFAAFAALLVYFLGFAPADSAAGHSATYWLWANWNPTQDYEHGWMVPLISLYMLRHACRDASAPTVRPSLHGLWLILPGLLLMLLSVRTNQPRITMGAVPILLMGSVWYFWGRAVARRCAFPLFFLWLAVPLPFFQQATVWLQLIAAQMAHWGAGLFGIETVLEGSSVSSADGSWDTFNIAGGCSGMRSLMALLMISFAWGYLASGLVLWKRLVLALSAVPLAVLANAFRVCSIFVFAEYVNPAFASKTWHDWSGLLFFFPASLVGLTVLHGLLAGEIPFFKKRRVVTRRNNAPPTTPAGSTTPAGGKEVQP